MKSYRVVRWSTGGVGALAIAAIENRRDLDLVGVWVHTPDTAGRDAGEPAGIGALGVRATTSADDVLAFAPDCICCTASGESTLRIMIDGEPSLTCELQVGSADSYSFDGMVATTMRVVNAIPFVCDAAPGIVTSTSLPLTPRHAFETS